MKVIKVNWEDYRSLEDNNDGLIYGLEEVNDDFPAYVEWFKTEEEREQTIKDNNMIVEE